MKSGGIGRAIAMVGDYFPIAGEWKANQPPLGTLPETNIAPENGWLEYYFPFGMDYFQVLC